MKALPLIDEEYRAKAEGIKTSFLGDPSFFSYEGEPVEETGPPVERFREIHRLAQTVEVSPLSFSIHIFMHVFISKVLFFLYLYLANRSRLCDCSKRRHRQSPR